MADTIAGVRIPDTALVKDATNLVREAEDALLFHHSRRVFLFGALQGKRRGLEVDPELLYIGALFHDMGLTDAYAESVLRFEVDSANAAREFLLGHGLSVDDAATVWTAIALHTTPGIPEFMPPEIALVTAGVETDVLGIDYGLLSAADISAVTQAHPRPDFKRRILEAFATGNKNRPSSTFGNVNADVLEHFSPSFKRGDFVEMIRGSDWPE